MNTLFQYLTYTGLAVLAMACQTGSKETLSELQTPKPEKIPHELTSNGNKRIDNYYWMRLTEEQKNAKTKDEQTSRSSLTCQKRMSISLKI